MVGNLRGIRESGQHLCGPYVFLRFQHRGPDRGWRIRYLTGAIVPVDVPLPPNAGHAPLTTFLLLTAFANGCTAMTGVEAVSNGVPAFRPPGIEERLSDAVAMALLAITMFVGITVLAHAYRVMPSGAESGVSQLGRAIFGGRTFSTTRCRQPPP